MTMFKSIRNWLRRSPYREGRTLSRFIACDIRRDILIVSSAKVDDGIITGRVRTTNILYLSRGLIREPEFEPARELRIDEMWHWTGKRWAACRTGLQSLIGSSPSPRTPNKALEQMTVAIPVPRDIKAQRAAAAAELGRL
jgi:hypothetical protein